MSEQTNRELAVSLSSHPRRGKRQFARAGGKFAGAGSKCRKSQIVSPAISASGGALAELRDARSTSGSRRISLCRTSSAYGEICGGIEAETACSRFNSSEPLSAPACAGSKPTSSYSRRRGLPRTPHRRHHRRYRRFPWRRRPEPPAHRRHPGHKPLRQVSWKRAQGPRSWR